MNTVITIYQNKTGERSQKVLWDSETGKTKVEPDGEWLYPENYKRKGLLKKALDYFKKS